jgi:hypothetical protein
MEEALCFCVGPYKQDPRFKKNLPRSWVLMTHTYNPSFLRSGGSRSKASLGKKVCKTPSQWWGVGRKLGMAVQASLSKKQNLISKITRAKRAGDMAQVIKCLPCKR